MFTGIIASLGIIQTIDPIGISNDMRLSIVTPWFDTGSIPVGASIACSGCCLTVVAVCGDSFTVDVSAQTLACTTIGQWTVGSQINLERPLKIGDEIGGHMISGHIDGVGEAMSMTAKNGSTCWQFRFPNQLARFIATKGCVAVNGVSLTVNEVTENTFAVNIVPHTAAVTGFGSMQPGDRVNIEIDMLARYVARLTETK